MVPAVTVRGPVDGRAARAERTRDAVVDALLALNEDGNLRPTAKEIADRAGVSLRSVYVHFDDLEDLFCAAGQRHFEHLQARSRPLPETGPLAARVEAFVAQRAELHEAGTGVFRAALLQEPFSPTMAKNMAIGRKFARAQLQAVFGTELANRSDAGQLLDALEVATNASTWVALRGYRHLEPEAAEATMGFMVRALLKTDLDRNGA